MTWQVSPVVCVATALPAARMSDGVFLPGVRLDAGIAESGVGYTGVAGTAIGSFNGA